MIVAPTPCYFTVLALDDAAQALMMEISPGVANDITELSLVSTDFDSDIAAIDKLDRVVDHVGKILANDVKAYEQFNPLYIPSAMEDVDNLLDLNIRSDGVRFTGFNGDPFAFKIVDFKHDDQVLVKFMVRYHPFELPLYTEIVEAHDKFNFN